MHIDLRDDQVDITISLSDDQIDSITKQRLDELADNMENYLHSCERPLKDDIKDYKMLIKAANYFRMPGDDQRRPLKFVAR